MRALRRAALLALAALLLAAPAAAARPPIVMIAFDEFSTVSLLDSHARVDAARYPAFGSLSRESTWFANATASLDETGRAMRSLLTGRTTWRYRRPIYSREPRNLFTLLGRRYRIEASEEGTSLCPRRLCPGVRTVNGRLVRARLASGRPERFRRWLRSLGPRARPTFFFKHVLLPHGPFRYLPSGSAYGEGGQDRLPWHLRHFDRWLVNQAYQRHLLQLEFTDRLLGEALARLRATGLYDRSLVVVTADNGESFGKLGNGHEISNANAADIALTPLFVKLPFQRSGRALFRHVRTVDVLPLIARYAGLRVPWRIEGHTPLGPTARRIPATTLLVTRAGRRIRLSLRTLGRRVGQSLQLKLRLFRRGLFGIGPHPELVGTPLAASRVLPANGEHAVLDDAAAYAGVRLASERLPAKLMGRLTGDGANRPTGLALAVNGVIRATAPTFAVRAGARRLFSAVVPPESFHDGANRVQVLALVRDSLGLALRPLY